MLSIFDSTVHEVYLKTENCSVVGLGQIQFKSEKKKEEKRLQKSRAVCLENEPTARDLHTVKMPPKL